MKDLKKRIRTAAAELMFARVQNVMRHQASIYIEDHDVQAVAMQWPKGDELKAFERIIMEAESEKEHELRAKCFKMFEHLKAKYTGTEFYDLLYHEVFSDIALPDHGKLKDKERVNEKEAKSSGDHQDRERPVEHPTEVVSALSPRGKRRRRRGPDAE